MLNGRYISDTFLYVLFGQQAKITTAPLRILYVSKNTPLIYDKYEGKKL